MRTGILETFGRQLRNFAQGHLPFDSAFTEVVGGHCGPGRSDYGQATTREHETEAASIPELFWGTRWRVSIGGILIWFSSSCGRFFRAQHIRNKRAQRGIEEKDRGHLAMSVCDSRSQAIGAESCSYAD